MKRLASFLTVLMLCALVTVLLGNLSSADAGNCEAKLVNHSFDCNFDDTLGPFGECLEFVTGGVSPFFDLFFGSFDYGCGCDATGPASSPSFNNSSSSFECSRSDAPFMVIGTIKGKKISVQGIGSDGEQYIATCTPRSSPCF